MRITATTRRSGQRGFGGHGHGLHAAAFTSDGAFGEFAQAVEDLMDVESVAAFGELLIMRGVHGN